MLRLVPFDGETTYMFTSGALATPDAIRAQFPAVDYFPHVLEINGDICQAVMSLNALRQNHDIDDALSAEEATAALQDILNTPPPVSTIPTPEQRTAAALEFLAISSMKDVVV